MIDSSQRGDLHNFNRAVKSHLTTDSVAVFNKPRSVFWELYFFGAKSPLKYLFTNTGIKMDLVLSASRGPFDNDIFSINLSNREIELKDFFLFGQLLAYSYYFGLQDLHKDNLLISPTGIQIIDVEQAFSELLLPNQTLLLPVSKEATWSGGLNALTSTTIDNLSKDQAKELINGFVQLTEFFLKNLENIKLIILESLPEFKKQPLRVFFRGTREYVEELSGKNKINNLFGAENTQLLRGDVPYFFMFLNKKHVYNYTSERWDIKAVDVPDEFLKFIDFCAKDPISLLEKSKVELRFARGLLYLSKKMNILNNEDLIWSSCAVTRSKESLIFNGFGLNMKSKV